MGLNVDPIEEEVVVYGLHPDCCRPRRGPEELHLFFLSPILAFYTIFEAHSRRAFISYAIYVRSMSE